MLRIGDEAVQFLSEKDIPRNIRFEVHNECSLKQHSSLSQHSRKCLLMMIRWIIHLHPLLLQQPSQHRRSLLCFLKSQGPLPHLSLQVNLSVNLKTTFVNGLASSECYSYQTTCNCFCNYSHPSLRAFKINTNETD